MARGDPLPQYSESDQRPYVLHYGTQTGNLPNEQSSLLLSKNEPFAHFKKRKYLFYVFAMILAVISYQLGTRRALDPEQWERIRQEWEQKRDQWMGREADIARREGAMKRKEGEWQSKREEERRVRDSFRWANLTPSTQCTRYGVREYTATFFPGYSWLSHSEKLTSCSNTEAVVMGHNYPKPDYCQFQNNQYIGHWSVGDLPDCKTYFEWFKDRGCVAPGSPLRRYEAHLGTQRPEDDGQIMCDTTPALLKGKSFDKPDSCAHWSEGWWGIFFIEDAGCQNLQVQS